MRPRTAVALSLAALLPACGDHLQLPAPIAHAGDDVVTSRNVPTQLHGSASSPHAAPAWQQVSGTPVTLDDPRSLTPTFTTPAASGALEFELVVTDANGQTSMPDSVVVTVVNSRPLANAGSDVTVTCGDLVVLEGNGADPDPADALTFAWTQLAGPEVSFEHTSPQVSFVAPFVAETLDLELQLVVSDGELSSEPASVHVIVQTPPSPVADAGADFATTRRVAARLDGSKSAPASAAAGPLTFSWTQVAGDAVSLDDPTSPRPRFVTPATCGALAFQLVVTDALARSSEPNTVVVTVGNNPPFADAGRSTAVEGGATVILDGSGTDPDPGDALTFAWTQVAGPSVPFVTTDPRPAITVPSGDAVLTFALTVSDGELTSEPSLVRIFVDIDAPIANAGRDLDVDGRELVTLDGTQTSAGSSTWSRLRWRQIGGPAVELGGATGKRPFFHAPSEAATLRFELTVSDGQIESSDRTIVVVRPWAGDELQMAANPFAWHGSDWVLALRLAGDRAYVVGGTFMVLDATVPGRPAPLATLPLYLNDIALDPRGYAVVTGLDLSVIDVTVPLQPNIVAALAWEEAPVAVAVSDSYAYVAVNGAGVRVVSLADPHRPEEVASCPTNGTFLLQIVGDYLYYDDADVGLRIADIRSPAAPVCGAADSRGKGISAMVSSGSIMYLVYSAGDLRALDVSSPGEPHWGPRLASGLTFWSSGKAVVSGDRLYVAAGPDGVLTFDLTNPSAPTYLGAVSGTTATHAVGVQRTAGTDYVWVGHFRGLDVVPVRDFAPPPATATVTLDRANALLDGDGVVYAATGANPVVLDARDAKAPLAVSGFGPSVDLGPARWAIDGDRLIAAGSNRMTVFDISQRWAPAQLASLYQDSLVDAAVTGSAVYGAVQGTGLAIFDISQPTIITRVGTPMVLPGGAQAVCTRGDRVLVASAFAGLHSVDPTTGEVVTVDFDSTATYSLDCSTTSAVVAANYSPTPVFDVTDPARPSLECSIPSFGYAHRAHIEGPLILIADPGSGGIVLERGATCEGWSVQARITGGDARDLAVVDDFAYIANWRRGIDVYPLQPIEMTRHHQAATRDELSYDIGWTALESEALEIRCAVTAGSCRVVTSDPVGKRAQLSWSLLESAVDAEIAVAVGDSHAFWIAKDHVSVRPPPP